ncbi:MAG: GNAT family N-acetyltransferase [Pseudobdellovibrionaceae bacterium]
MAWLQFVLPNNWTSNSIRNTCAVIAKNRVATGIERSHRNQGFGSKMMQEGIAWAKSQPHLDWLQLYVFEDNLLAKKLYQKFGFVETGTTPDMFRVHGKQMADTAMILKLK